MYANHSLARLALRLSLCLSTVWLLAALSTQVVFAQSVDATPSLSPDAQAVADTINSIRADHGIHPFRLSPALIVAAQRHADDMAANANYSHWGSDGSSVSQRVARTGYQSNNGVSENWVAVSNPSQAVPWWLNSYVHRTNLLNGKWTELGIGARKDPRNGMTIYVAVFGGGGGAEPAPPVQKVVAAATAATAPTGGAPQSHVVRPGDTLLGIGLRYGVEWQTIAALNGLSEHSVLQIGQALRLRSGVPAAQTGGPVGGPRTGTPYMVQPGDTLSTIAGRYDITWQALATNNGLQESSVLNIGQTLYIPSQAGSGATSQATSQATAQTQTNRAGGANAQASAPAPRYHTVQTGETVISIAVAYRVDWKEMLRINGLADNTILTIGQRLQVPSP